jgi:hypothetical protein
VQNRGKHWVSGAQDYPERNPMEDTKICVEIKKADRIIYFRV